MTKNFKLTAGLLGLALTAAAAQAGISAGENVTFPLTDTVDLSRPEHNARQSAGDRTRQGGFPRISSVPSA